MQRWMIGGGVVVLAVLLAGVLIPRTDTGAELDEGKRRGVEPIDLQVNEVEKLRSSIDQKRARTENALQKSEARVAAGGFQKRSDRYRNKLAAKDLTYDSSVQHWHRLDDLLDASDSGHALKLRSAIADMERMMGAFYSSPELYKKLRIEQSRIVGIVREAGLDEDARIADALEAIEIDMKKTSRIVGQL